MYSVLLDPGLAANLYSVSASSEKGIEVVFKGPRYTLGSEANKIGLF